MNACFGRSRGFRRRAGTPKPGGRIVYVTCSLLKLENGHCQSKFYTACSHTRAR